MFIIGKLSLFVGMHTVYARYAFAVITSVNSGGRRVE